MFQNHMNHHEPLKVTDPSGSLQICPRAQWPISRLSMGRLSLMLFAIESTHAGTPSTPNPQQSDRNEGKVVHGSCG